MRLALQALFSTTEANEEGAARRALLERRLRSSERSAGFFRRLRGSVDDAALQAPEIFAEESFPDANVVAEYLDSQAPSELARAYEDACWDSPEMLAEVGRCYDILNNDALNAVVVPKNCRRRLYYIAWEENVANVSSEDKNASILTNLATSTEEAAVETVASEAPRRKKSREEERAERKASQATKRNEKKTVKSADAAGTVGATLAAERSLARRFKRFSARLTLALGLLAASYYGWQTLDDGKVSETFELGTPRQELAATEEPVAERKSDEALRPTTISSSNLADIPTISLIEPPSQSDNEAYSDWEIPASEEAETYKLAALPNPTEAREESAAHLSETTPLRGKTRVGLGTDEPWRPRPSIEIPAQNNDVFGKTQLY